VGAEEGMMPLARVTLARLAVPLNRGDFPAFIEAVERLPSAERNILTVLGAGALLGTLDHGRYLRENSSRNLVASLAQFTEANVEVI
jgi:hypothetical protein